VIQAVDGQIDFTFYDLWRSTGDYTHTQQANSIVDFVIICWRNIDRDLGLNPTLRNRLGVLDYQRATRAQINWSNSGLIGVDKTMVNGVLTPTRYVYTGYLPRYNANDPSPFQNGSGFHFTNFLQAEPNIRSTGAIDGYFRGMVHETGHILLGPHRESGSWTMIASSDHRSYCPSAKEMIELGWANIKKTVRRNSMSFTDNNVTLGDLYRTGDCIAVEIEPGANNQDEWYILENHQMSSKFDFVRGQFGEMPGVYDPNRTATKGLYVLYHRSPGGDPKQHVQSARGEYLWGKTVESNLWGDNGIAFERQAESRLNGATQTELMTTPDFTRGFESNGVTPKHHTSFPIYFVKQNGNISTKQHFLNEDKEDHHDQCRKPVWSPWSNPSSNYNNHGNWPDNATPPTSPKQTGVSVVIQSVAVDAQGTGTYTVTIANNNQPVGPPSVPINLAAPSSTIANYIGVPNQYGVNLDWDANVEPDIAGYHVYRSPGHTTTGWEKIHTLVGTTSTSYFDNQSYPAAPQNTVYLGLVYRIAAYDVDGMESSVCSPTKFVSLEWVNYPEQCCQTLSPLNDIPSTQTFAKSVPVSVTPNPTSGSVAFYPPSPYELQGTVTLEVNTINGANVRRLTFNWDAFRTGVSINVSDMTEGTYFMTMSNGKAVRTASFVVQ